jgi:hypothetical protein
MKNYFYKDNTLVVIEDNSLKRGVTHLFHNSPTASHPRISKTINLVFQHYWWPHMDDFIMAYVKGCTICQLNKVNTPYKTPIVSDHPN